VQDCKLLEKYVKSERKKSIRDDLWVIVSFDIIKKFCPRQFSHGTLSILEDPKKSKTFGSIVMQI
jgi:hypothetical protein